MIIRISDDNMSVQVRVNSSKQIVSPMGIHYYLTFHFNPSSVSSVTISPSSNDDLKWFSSSFHYNGESITILTNC
ncbi:hypothetical protein BLOT_000264 [Blomia tropicalis]|nr:hypothetical protein BLOT_000264 [Blomia tropicalis]